jgi:hypothetical protein
MENNNDDILFPNVAPIHACEVEVTFPTNLQAEQALQILQVDKEPSDRVTKTFQLVKKEGEDGIDDNDVASLKV